MAQRLVTVFEAERESNKFQELWQAILKTSNDIGVEPSRKRSVSRQQNHTNPPVTDTDRVAYYYAFLDHILSHLKTRFRKELEGALLATSLLPGSIQSISIETIGKNTQIIFLTQPPLRVK